MARQRRMRIAEQWDEFCKMVFKDQTISPVQRQEMRRAFYAGAEAIMRPIMRDASRSEEFTEDDMHLAEDLEAEIKDFAERLQKGIA